MKGIGEMGKSVKPEKPVKPMNHIRYDFSEVKITSIFGL